MVHESVDHEKLWWVCLIDLIHDTRNLCTHLKADGIRARVVIMATLVGNQSERSKISLDQSDSRIWPM